MKLLGSMTNLLRVIFAGTGGDTTLQPADLVAGNITLKLPATAGTLRDTATPIVDDDIQSISADKVTSGTMAKERGGTGADMSSVTFPSSGTIPVRSTGTFDITWTQSGGYSRVTTVTYTKIGKEVTLMLPNFLASCTASAYIAGSAVPAKVRPAILLYLPVIIRQNSTSQIGIFSLDSTGDVKLYSNADSGVFISGQQGGLPYNVSVTYMSAT